MKKIISLILIILGLVFTNCNSDDNVVMVNKTHVLCKIFIELIHSWCFVRLHPFLLCSCYFRIVCTFNIQEYIPLSCNSVYFCSVKVYTLISAHYQLFMPVAWIRTTLLSDSGK